jgi:hypothetical protein
VQAVTLGRARGAQPERVEATDTFGVRDVIGAKVETEGTAGRGRLEARWTYLGGQAPVVVQEQAMELADLKGAKAHVFHLAKQKDWPKGPYQVEIRLNGITATTKDFMVR